MNKKKLFIGILLSLSTALFTLESCNSKEKTETQNHYETESTSGKVSSNDIDDMLDSYEDYVDQYIDYMKKVSKGDMNALADAPALMEKAKEYGDKIENSKGDMTAEQIARMSQIMNKMNVAISDMSQSMK